MTTDAPRPDPASGRLSDEELGAAWANSSGGWGKRMLKRHIEALAAENEALKAELQRRLAAVEAGIAAEIQVAERDHDLEWPADLAARGRMKGRREGLKIATQIVAGAE